MLTQNQAWTLFISVNPERAKEATEAKFEVNKGWFMNFKERNSLHNIEMQGEASSADVEAAASYPEDLARMIHEGGATKHQLYNVDKKPYIGRGCHLGLSELERSWCLASKFQK